VVLFHFLNNLAGVSPLLDWLVRAIVNDYAVPALFTFILGAFWFGGETESARQRNQRAIIIVLLGIALTNIVIRTVQIYYFRPRPFATEQVRLLFYRPSVSSFPSVPVATLFCYATGLWSANRKVGWGLFILGILFGLARVIAGVHYPLDIVGGALLGICGTAVVLRYAKFLDPVINRLISWGQSFNLA
jgi:undecaprenyl-diphosphatase